MLALATHLRNHSQKNEKILMPKGLYGAAAPQGQACVGVFVRDLRMIINHVFFTQTQIISLEVWRVRKILFISTLGLIFMHLKNK
jgi:hypothetical protein